LKYFQRRVPALPVRGADGTIKPGVKRSETPGSSINQISEPAERATAVAIFIDYTPLPFFEIANCDVKDHTSIVRDHDKSSLARYAGFEIF
jgi:hypothetical protein